MSLEKSGCLQLTQEEFNLFQNALNGNATELVKVSALFSRFDMSSEEVKAMLDAGEYRIVED